MNWKRFLRIFPVIILLFLLTINFGASGSNLKANLISLAPQNFPFIYLDLSVSGTGETTLGSSNFEVYEMGGGNDCINRS